MPSFSTHYIFAKEMLPVVAELSDFKLNEDAVLLGSQGPDIFFFCRILPWMKGKSGMKIGIDLHHSKPAEILDAMREYCEIADNKDIAKSYVYGFILHYALDRNCHPYVYYLQYKIADLKPRTNPSSTHNVVEFAMDSYLLNKRMGIENPISFDTASTVTDDEAVISEVGKIYAYVTEKVLENGIDASIGECAVRDIKQLQSDTRDDSGVKRVIISTVETLASPITKNYKVTSFLRPRKLESTTKYANLEHKKWKSPFDDSIHTESFEDLFELSKDDAKTLLEGYIKGDDTFEITKNISFLTGVEVE